MRCDGRPCRSWSSGALAVLLLVGVGVAAVPDAPGAADAPGVVACTADGGAAAVDPGPAVTPAAPAVRPVSRAGAPVPPPGGAPALALRAADVLATAPKTSPPT